jgi:phosphoheptose isomerase
MTAISNDISYDDVYSFQLDALGQEGDVLVAISSSGNSPNVVKAIETAKSLKMKTIALTGFFRDNKCAQLADISLHIDIPEYEATEDVHQAIMHMIAKYIRNKNEVTI